MCVHVYVCVLTRVRVPVLAFVLSCLRVWKEFSQVINGDKNDIWLGL